MRIGNETKVYGVPMLLLDENHWIAVTFLYLKCWLKIKRNTRKPINLPENWKEEWKLVVPMLLLDEKHWIPVAFLYPKLIASSIAFSEHLHWRISFFLSFVFKASFIVFVGPCFTEHGSRERVHSGFHWTCILAKEYLGKVSN